MHNENSNIKLGKIVEFLRKIFFYFEMKKVLLTQSPVPRKITQHQIT